MDTPFGSLGKFLAGRVFSTKKIPERIRVQISETRRKRIAAAHSVRVFLRAAAFAGAVALTSVYIQPVAGTSAAWRVGLSEVSEFGRGAANLAAHLRDAREYFEMSQQEAARVLHVSESSLEKLEQGSTSRPSDSLIRRYLALIELVNLHRSVLKENQEASLAYWEAPSRLWDGLSAHEYAKQTDGQAIFEVLAAHRRILG